MQATTRTLIIVGLTVVPILSVTSVAVMQSAGATTSGAQEAPAAFDNRSNGLTTQAVFDGDKDIFDEQEFIEDGLGPVYNAQACGECHQNPTSGGISQITELRAGHFDGQRFVDHVGGSLINDRSIHADFQERVLAGNEVRTFRTSLNTLGDGFVECIDSNTLIRIRDNQPSGQRGTVIQVPLLEAPGQTRVGRFGWKNQHASLVSFSADAYLNEMGITTPMLPVENTSNGRSVAAIDTVADPEDDGADVDIFARFMRATKAPPRHPDATSRTAQDGSAVFDQIRCNTCHVRSIVTVPPGTVINGGTFTCTSALGNKVIHPFSDFLLHNVGTGDGIVQNGGQSTRNQLRTAPLWGFRTRTRMMHDGNSVAAVDAILRHAGQASASANAFRNLSTSQKNQLLFFLNTL